MNSVLLSPHHDDEVLFSAFSIMRERPHVIVVFESHLQQARGNLVAGAPITNEIRQWETREALAELYGRREFGPHGSTRGDSADEWDEGLDLEFWPFRDTRPDWWSIDRRIGALAGVHEHVYAPAPLVEGHEQHNQVGELALVHVPRERLTLYTTYVGGSVRVATNTPVRYEPEWVERKLRALACYRSQIHLWPHHFLSDQREYYADVPDPLALDEPT